MTKKVLIFAFSSPDSLLQSMLRLESLRQPASQQLFTQWVIIKLALVTPTRPPPLGHFLAQWNGKEENEGPASLLKSVVNLTLNY